MLHNRVKETTTGTGTGNLTLAGAVTNYRTFNTAFSTDRIFSYWIVDDTNNVWETGLGFLQTSTTLVRDRVVANSSGTTSALNLSAGTKDVFCEQNYVSAYCTVDINDDAAQPAIFDLDNSERLTTWSVNNNSEVHYNEFYLTVGGWYSGMIAEIGAAQASSTARMGVYSLVHGRPDKKLAETGSIDTSTTGVKTPSFSGGNIHLNCGWWALAVISDNNAVDWLGHPIDGGRGGPFGQDNATLEHPSKRFYHSGSGIVLPTTATATGTFGREMATLGLLHA